MKRKGITEKVKGTVRQESERETNNIRRERKSRVEIRVVDTVVNWRN